MSREQWCQRLFESIDAKRTEEFMSFLTPDACFRYGSAPPAHGSKAITQAVEHFFASVGSLSHRVLDLWETPGHLICRGEVRYQRLDGRRVQIPFCNVLTMRGDQIACYDIYLDATPLTAE